jgi:hypothetical protein
MTTQKAQDLFDRMDQAHREHTAWRQMCKHLEKLGHEVNSAELLPLVCAIRLWGEELHALRLECPEHDEKSLRDKRDEYKPHYINSRLP